MKNTKKQITITAHVSQPRQPGPLTKDEIQQLTQFFIALIDCKTSYEATKIWTQSNSKQKPSCRS
ncbi:MAG: hypothetical protein ACXWL2_01905 [Candidatus Chromulinivorax sp.]